MINTKPKNYYDKNDLESIILAVEKQRELVVLLTEIKDLLKHKVSLLNRACDVARSLAIIKTRIGKEFINLPKEVVDEANRLLIKRGLQGLKI